YMPDKSPRFAGSPSGSAGRCAWHLPPPVERCSRGLASPQRECRLRRVLFPPPEFSATAHARSGGHGQRAGLEIAVQDAGIEQLDAGRALDVALDLARDRNRVGADAAGQLGTGLDRKVALDVDVTLEPAGEPHMAGAVDLAFDGDVRCDDR